MPIECEIHGVRRLEKGSETWIVQLCDPGSGLEAPTLDWILHHKYLVLLPTYPDAVKRSSSRGFLHAVAQAKYKKSYPGKPLLEPKRNILLCNAQLHHRWNQTPPSPSLLPTEDAIVLLQNVQEAEAWQDFNSSHISSAHPPDAPVSFKARVLSIPPNAVQVAQSDVYNVYVQPDPELGATDPTCLDVILGDSDDRPLAVLRLTSTHRLLALCLKEGDLLCLHNAHLISGSHSFTSSGSVYSQHSNEPSEIVKMKYRLPLFSYESNTLLFSLPKEILERRPSMDVTRDTTESPPASDNDLRHAKNFRFHGPKVTPILLQPHWNNVTMIGYVTRVTPRDDTVPGYRRYGLRLKDTNTSNFCDVTIWEPHASLHSMISKIRPGNLVLVTGLWTVLRKRENRLLANISQETGQIINFSMIQGMLASHPDIGPLSDLSHLLKPLQATPESRGRTYIAHGPFMLLDCTIWPSTMTLPISLYHGVCSRSIGVQPLPSSDLLVDPNVTLQCSFCSACILDWKNECDWQFEVEWNLKCANSTLSVLAAPEVSDKLLNIDASEYLQLSAPEKDMVVLGRVSDPLIGRASVSRTPDSTLFLDLFIANN